MTKEDKIKEAANTSSCSSEYGKQAFIEGATSEAAKEYWLEKIVEYIKTDSECSIPVEKMFNEDKTHITKKQYGLVLIAAMCEELLIKFKNKK